MLRMSIIAAQSELDAVNSMLATIGEMPVSTLEGGLHADAIIALDTLRQVSREVQQIGWYFNIERNYDLPPDLDGHINLPDNFISVDIEPRSTLTPQDVATRGNRLYNMGDHTYVFDDTLTATITVLLPFEELPETAKSYVTVRASRLFLSRVVGSETLQQFTRQDEATTFAALKREQVRKTDRNFLSPHRKSRMGIYSTARILDRRI